MAGSPWRGQCSISSDGKSVTLHRFEGAPPSPAYFNHDWIKSNYEHIGLASVLDVETSGLSASDDSVIEIGISHFKYNRLTAEFLAVHETYSALHDPGVPLSSEITALTGLTDEAVRGKRIDWLSVERIIAASDFIIAHNAGFDRAFIEKYTPAVASKKLWACSLKQIDWSAKGFGAQKLEVLGIFHGFFIDSHRALSDANGLLYLLQMQDPTQGHTPYLKELIANAHRPFAKISAFNSPFETKDLLKQRRYRWDPAQKTWFKQIYQDDVEVELAWLESTIYKGPFRGRCDAIPLTENFRQP
jgi:DNA polymerase-3 subunit epsilon